MKLDQKGQGVTFEQGILVAITILFAFVAGVTTMYFGEWGPFAPAPAENQSASVIDTVNGTVTDAATGDAIETQSINVTMTGPEVRSVTTDTNGRVSWSDVLAGTYSIEADDTDNNYYRATSSATLTKKYTGTRPTKIIKTIPTMSMWNIGTLRNNWDTADATSVDNTATKENMTIDIGNSESDSKIYDLTLELDATNNNSNRTLLDANPEVISGDVSIVTDNAYDDGADWHIDLRDVEGASSTVFILQWTTTGNESSQAASTIDIDYTLDDTPPVDGAKDNLAETTGTCDITFA